MALVSAAIIAEVYDSPNQEDLRQDRVEVVHGIITRQAF